MRSVFIFFFALYSGFVYAQNDYVVTHKGDTLAGELKILSYDLVDRVQVNANKKKTVFTAMQVKSVFLEGETFRPIRQENSIRLMKLLKPGYLSLFGFRMPNQITYEGRMLMKRMGSTQEVPNLAFKKILASFLEDCEEVSNKIKEGELARKDLDAIIDNYNACIEKQSNEKVAEVVIEEKNETVSAIGTLRKKIEESSLESKKDVLDLLNDIAQKVGKKESVPNYLTEGLKSYLANQEQFQAELNNVLDLLKN